MTMTFRKKLVAIAGAILLSAGLTVGGASSAFAATGNSGTGCTATANAPYKSGTKAYASGSSSCNYGATGRVLAIEIHHVSGFWHPYVAGNSVAHTAFSKSISASGCYPSQLNNQAEYFNQARTSTPGLTGGWVISANGTITIGC